MSINRMLLIVDPQIDFINGSLPVPGAEEAMNALARYVAKADGRYACKIITADRHPYNHCSFAANGGSWPLHCVHDTVGAAIWPSLFEAVYSTTGTAIVLHKGENADTDQYSVFQNRDAADKIIDLINRHDIRSIDICGLAGNVCVASTITDALTALPECALNILARFSPSLDDGTTLRTLTTLHSIPLIDS